MTRWNIEMVLRDAVVAWLAIPFGVFATSLIFAIVGILTSSEIIQYSIAISFLFVYCAVIIFSRFAPWAFIEWTYVITSAIWQLPRIIRVLLLPFLLALPLIRLVLYFGYLCADLAYIFLEVLYRVLTYPINYFMRLWLGKGEERLPGGR